MSETFKPLTEQISERMVNLLKDNRSIFTKPMKEDGTSQFVMPFNAKTKQKYTGTPALVLLMQNRRDPRWLSYDQAAYNKTPVKKGAHGTLIEFFSNNKLQQAIKDGQPVVKEDGKPKMERVKLGEPEKVEAW
jgi:antirestriction protein ArdC